MHIYLDLINELFSRRCLNQTELTQWLSKRLDHPYRNYPTIHIAGTNGKGSAALKIAKALEFSGYRVGLMTSPHIDSYCERISINGETIPEDVVVEKLQKLFAFCRDGGREPAFFHLTTFLGFEYFFERGVDVAVIETGIGGRLDPTNVITPILSVITSIGKDHEEILGYTLGSIAQEKAGIIKKGVPVVIGPNAHFREIREKACERESPMIDAQEGKGFYDQENTQIACAALNYLKSHFVVSDEAILKGVGLRPPCRYERVGNVVFDVAHNVPGFERLLQALEGEFGQKKLHFIFGMKKGKNISAILKLIEKRASQIDLISEFLGEKVEILPTNAHLYTTDRSLRRNLEEALKRPDPIVVCGTFKLMHPAKIALEKMHQPLWG